MGNLPLLYPEVTSNFLVLYVEVVYDVMYFLRVNKLFYRLITSPTTVQHLYHVNHLTRKDTPLTFSKFLLDYSIRWYPDLVPMLPDQILEVVITNDDADGFDMLDISVDLPKMELVGKLMYHKCYNILRKCIKYYKEIEGDVTGTVSRLYNPGDGIYCYGEWDRVATRYVFFNGLVPEDRVTGFFLGRELYMCYVESLLLRGADTSKMVEAMLQREEDYSELIIRYGREDLVGCVSCYFNQVKLLSSPKVAKKCLELGLVTEHDLYDKILPERNIGRRAKKVKHVVVSWRVLVLIDKHLTQEDVWNLCNQSVETSDSETLDWLLPKLTIPYENTYCGRMLTVRRVMRKRWVVEGLPYSKKSNKKMINDSFLGLILDACGNNVSSRPAHRRYRTPLLVSSDSSGEDR
jgi:hypothetical protein